MNAIQQRYLDANTRLVDLLMKKHATLDALNILQENWSQLSSEEIERQFAIDSDLDLFFGVDAAREELRTATEALVNWGLDHAFTLPMAQHYHDLLTRFQKALNQRGLYGSQLQTQVIDLILRLKV